MALPFNIAIDGHSSCGKSTIAKAVASKYGMRYIDTGAMYRAVTLYCMNNKIIKNKVVDIVKLLEVLDQITINFEFNAEKNKSETILNGKNVEQMIRGFEVSDRVSVVAQIPEVRKKLIFLQKKIGDMKNVVMDGRDIGSIVFPDAKLKLFITANAKIRAPTAPIPPPSVGVKTPNEMPPIIKKNSAITAQTLDKDFQRIAQVALSARGAISGLNRATNQITAI